MTTGALNRGPDASPANEGACSVGAVLAWAVTVGATVALCEPPDGPPGLGAAGIALIAPAVSGVPQPLDVPPAVRAALARDWRTLVAVLGDVHASLRQRGLPGWPESLEGAGAALLTVAAWAETVRLGFDAEVALEYGALAGAAVASGYQRWHAAIAAVEHLVGPKTPRAGVRARHLAMLREATGG